MSQVLTVPLILSKHQPKERPWGKVVRYLYLLPVLIQVAILSNDCYTFDVGLVISKFNTVFSITTSFSFLVLSILLTYWCLRLSHDIDETWEETALRIEGEEPSPETVSNSAIRPDICEQT